MKNRFLSHLEKFKQQEANTLHILMLYYNLRKNPPQLYSDPKFQGDLKCLGNKTT